MGLAPGSRLGPYEIVALLGAGGMGEVYRARDTRLQRTVAIKILPPQLASDPQRKLRFEREARAISSLKHPHICTLHDIGREDAIEFLVMEQLDGETLARRLSRGPLPLPVALGIGVEIADALDAAHRQRITHRDLKPANVMLTPSGAKLMDFGLATLGAEPLTSDAASAATTGDVPLTTEGTVLGTLQYMAPEQVEGRRADSRTDIFALGAVIYEMVAGRPPFVGHTRASLMAAILSAEAPVLSSAQPASPLPLDRLVTSCLARDREQRWQSAADLRRELEWIREDALGAGPAPGRLKRGWQRLAVAASLGALVTTAALWSAGWRPRAPVGDVGGAQFAVVLPSGESLHEYSDSIVAMSPDGALLAYVVQRGDERGLYVRRLDSLTAEWLPGTERASNPFFSPEGRRLGFESGSTLKTIALDGGPPQVICDVPFFAGASWAPDDTIIFTPTFTAGLWAVPAAGGKPRRLAAPVRERGEGAYLRPEVLPGGEAVLFTTWMGTSFDESLVSVLSLRTGVIRVLVRGGFNPRYASSGHLLYERGVNLMAVPFDLDRLEVTGPPVIALEGVLRETSEGAPTFSLSRNGTLAYVPGIERSVSRSLVWVDRQGRMQPIIQGTRPYSSVRVSPDGQRLALWLEEATASVWVSELRRGALTRITFGGDDHSPVWSPDGKQIAFESSRSGVHQLYVRPADGTGREEQITTGEYESYIGDWSPDGRSLVYTEFHPDTGADLWIVGLDSGHPTRPFLRTPSTEKAPTFSPDGRWLAYVSNESGRSEVYVEPFQGPSHKWQASTEGGEEPAWARSGRELFFRSGGKMMVVPVTNSPTFGLGRPVPLFSGSYLYGIIPNRTYDVAADGRFAMIREPDATLAPRQINVVLGWSERLRRRAVAASGK
jgi:eukaryotic-like serine/threonine-protein kinase